MVQDAKSVAINITDGPSISRWRESNRAVSYFSLYLIIFNDALHARSQWKVEFSENFEYFSMKKQSEKNQSHGIF